MERVLLALLALTWTGAANAQDTGVSKLASTLGQRASAPLDRAIAPLGGVQLSVDQNSTSLSVRASSVHSHMSAADAHGESTGFFDSWNVTINAPLNSTSSATQPSTLDSLANATTVEFRFTRFLAHGLLSTSSGQRLAICDKAYANLVARTKVSKADAEKASCDTKFVHDNDPTEEDAFEGQTWAPHASTLIWGFSGKAGYQKFDFHDPVSLATTSQTHAPWSVGVFVAWLPSHNSPLFTLSGQHQESYKAANSQTLCPPGGAGPNCVTGVGGPPIRTVANLVSLEARDSLTPIAAIGPIAFSADVTYDFSAHVTGLDLPIYFVTDSKGGLTGGLKVGWRSDTHNTTVGVFVTKAFSMFNFSQ